MLVYLVTIDFI